MIADVPSRQVAARVPPDVIDELDRIGTARNKTRADLIREAIELYVKINGSAAVERAAQEFAAAAVALSLSDADLAAHVSQVNRLVERTRRR